MIRFDQVSKHFGTQSVLDAVSFQVNPGEHAGIVGPNGAGKSTIFNLIVGDLTPDRGKISMPARCRIGYVHQQLNTHAVKESLIEYAERAMPELQALHDEIHTLETRLHSGWDRANDTENPPRPEAPLQEGEPSAPAEDGLPATREGMLRRLGDLQTRLEHLEVYTLRNRAERMLCGLGFAPETLTGPFRALSGGWQSRAELVRALLAEPDILLLDEPSNYLDISAVERLREYLQEFRGTLLLISHDRFLLNSLTTVTIEIANAKTERYAGNYDTYVNDRVRRYEQRIAAKKNQDRKREQVERFIERFRAKNTRATLVQSRIKQLEKMEEVSIPVPVVSRGKMRLRPPPHCGVEVVRLEGAGCTYDGQRWVLRGIDLSVSRGEKIALVGFNGLGKTTLLRMLAGSLPLSEGKRVLGHKVTIGYQSQDFAETMDPDATVFSTIRATAGDATELEIRTLLGGFGFSGDAIEKTVNVLSGGEKIRLAFARLLMNPPNFLVLDEPTTHLDIQACETLEKALQDYKGTLCVVSHDVDFVRHVATGIIAMTPPGITRYAGGYDYYRQKLQETEAAAAAQADRDAGAKKGPVAGGGEEPRPGDRKALRRQRALERQQWHERTKEIQKTIRQAERQIEIFEKEQAELVKQLSGEVGSVDFASVNRRLKSIQDEIVRYTQRWERAASELEALNGERKQDEGRGTQENKDGESIVSS